MLSKAELEYLKSPELYNSEYQRILRYRIRHKVQRVKALLPLLEAHGFSVMESCNGVTEICNGQRSSIQPSYNKFMVRSPGFEPGIASLEGLCPKPV